MANSKLTGLTSIGTLATEDLLYVVDDPGGTPASRKITVGQLLTDLGVPRVVASASPSSVATVDLTLPSGYAEFELTGWLIPATNLVDMYLRFDDGGGFDSGTEYQWAGATVRAGGGPFDNGADGTDSVEISLNTQVQNSAGAGISFSIRMKRALDAAFTHVHWTGSTIGATAGPEYAMWGQGRHQVAAAISGARLLFSSGNIADGEVRLIGIP